ncbi:MAG: hypothetical protein R2737_17295 [Candidatus Nanopelagicales bacterium]
MAEAPRRQAVTHPRTAAARRRSRGSASAGRRDLSEQTPLGTVLLLSLKRSQLRLALLVAASVGALLGGIPVLFLAVPALRNATLAGIPAGWLLLGLVVFPVICLVAWWYVRAAERNERRFTDLVDRT